MCVSNVPWEEYTLTSVAAQFDNTNYNFITKCSITENIKVKEDNFTVNFINAPSLVMIGIEVSTANVAQDITS